MTSIVVIGAGVSGLVAAHALRSAGHSVALVDKGIGPGGRLATRRIAGTSFDSGAQFFTVRSREFGDLVTRWTDEGCPIRVWGHGLARSRHVDDGPDAADTSGDGHPRHVVAGGMNVLASHLSRELDVHPSEAVRAIAPCEEGWEVVTNRTRITAASLILTAPVPESLALLDAGGTVLPPPTHERLAAIRYAPCLALLITVDRTLDLPPPGGVQLAEGPVQTLGDNQAKGASNAPSLTVHLRGDISARRFDEPPGHVAADVLRWIHPWLRGAAVTGWQVKRWPYAQPVRLDAARSLATDVNSARIVFAGDAFGEARIEGAARSGLSAARSLTSPRS